MTHFDPKAIENQDPLDFWEERYAQSTDRSRGKVGFLLKQYVHNLSTARALELGCSTGDDSIWLAEQGWQVTAVDISNHAIQTAQRLAQEAGMLDKIRFLNTDLAAQFPVGSFELVCALYFQSPFDFPRANILQAAAARLVPGGHLLVVSHASSPPWASKHRPDFEFPTLESEWETLGLTEQDWEIMTFDLQSRLAQGPDDQQAEVHDNVLFARRR